jgi:hypothetical protein
MELENNVQCFQDAGLKQSYVLEENASLGHVFVAFKAFHKMTNIQKQTVNSLEKS